MKILIVDDSVVIQRVLKHTLQRAGHDVRTASGGKRGLELLAQERSDLAIIDLLMPEMNGFELLQVFRQIENLHNIPVIMLTASGLSTDPDMAQNHGASAFLSKPVSSTELLDTVGKLAPAEHLSQ